MREPTEPGTIVLCSNGEALLLVDPTRIGDWWSITRKVWVEWSEFSDLVPSIVRHGYTPPPPPTPEPTLWGAIVRDSKERTASLTGLDPYPWTFSDHVSSNWGYMAQPVEILFPGVPDV
jgi:hypothetical protein